MFSHITVLANPYQTTQHLFSALEGYPTRRGTSIYVGFMLIFVMSVEGCDFVDNIWKIERTILGYVGDGMLSTNTLFC